MSISIPEGLHKDKNEIASMMLHQLSIYWPVLFLLLLVVYFSVTGTGFFTIVNFQNIGVAAAQNLILAIGQTFVIICAGTDLSVGFTSGLSAVFTAMVIRDMFAAGINPWLAILCGLIIGMTVSTAAGTVNGILVAKFKVPPFIGTLGMFGIARGIALAVTGGPPVSGLPPESGILGNDYLVYYGQHSGFTFFSPPPASVDAIGSVVKILPYPVLIALSVVIICHIVLSRTLFGQHTYAVGGNLEAARRSGINVNKHLIKVYALSGFMAGLAGFVYVTRFTSGSPNAGEPLLLDSIAAVFIGGASMFGGEGTMIGTLIGALIIAILKTGFVLQGINPFWQYVAVGSVIILAVLIDQANARFKRTK